MLVENEMLASNQILGSKGGEITAYVDSFVFIFILVPTGADVCIVAEPSVNIIFECKLHVAELGQMTRRGRTL